MKWPDYSKHRPLFTDGFNSFWHVVFGILATEFKIIIPLFVAYQFLDIYEKNVWVDIGEFTIGFVATYILSFLFRPKFIRY